MMTLTPHVIIIGILIGNSDIHNMHTKEDCTKYPYKICSDSSWYDEVFHIKNTIIFILNGNCEMLD